VAQRARVVQPQVLDVVHRHARRIKNPRDDFCETGRIGAGKDAAVDPGVERSRNVATDEMQQTATSCARNDAPDDIGQR
jgi:hypothetical protein